MNYNKWKEEMLKEIKMRFSWFNDTDAKNYFKRIEQVHKKMIDNNSCIC